MPGLRSQLKKIVPITGLDNVARVIEVLDGLEDGDLDSDSDLSSGGSDDELDSASASGAGLELEDETVDGDDDDEGDNEKDSDEDDDDDDDNDDESVQQLEQDETGDGDDDDDERDDDDHDSDDDDNDDDDDDDESVGQQRPRRAARARDTGAGWKKKLEKRDLREFAERTGSAMRIPETTSPEEYFEMYFTHDIISLLVDMSDLNANNKTGSGLWDDSIPQEDRVIEMKGYLGLCIAMGIIKLPSLEMYWQKQNWVFDVASFNEIMPRDRFIAMHRFLHLCDETDAPAIDDPTRDKLYKLRPLLDTLLPKFEKLYVPEREISIDESMIPFKGRISFRQFIPSKRTRFGIKVFNLAESRTGYICRLQVYTGKSTVDNTAGVGLSERVVHDLMQPYVGKGYHLYLDNFYSSPALYQALYDGETYACGTVRATRRGFPDQVKIAKPRQHERGHSEWRMRGPVLAQSWVDNRVVYFLSTIHAPTYPAGTPLEERTVTRRGRINQRCGVAVKCPPLLKHYNSHMGGVDLADKQTKYYNSGRRSRQWYRRVFFYLLEVALNNAFILESKVVDHRPEHGRVRGPLQFRVELVTALVTPCVTFRQQGRPRTTDVPRLHQVGIHLPKKLEKSLVCKVCSRRTSYQHQQEYGHLEAGVRPRVPYVPRSTYSCTQCDVPLCISQDKNCFARWHTVKEYWK